MLCNEVKGKHQNYVVELLDFSADTQSRMPFAKLSHMLLSCLRKVAKGEKANNGCKNIL